MEQHNEFESDEPTLVTAYAPIGREALRQQLRGLGREGFRRGGMPHTAIAFAAVKMQRGLSADERREVMAGFAAERAEAVAQ